MKKKLSNKISLKKETLNSLNKTEMNDLKGGQTYACWPRTDQGTCVGDNTCYTCGESCIGCM